MDFFQALIVAACGGILLIGLIGVILPSFPGIILMWAAFSLFAAVTQFEIIGLDHIFTVTLLTFAVFILEYFSRFRGAHEHKASRWGFAGAIIGGTIGSAFDSLPALLIGSFAGAILGRVYSGHDKSFNIKFKSYTLIGFVGETIVKLSIGVIILGLYVYKLSEYY